jgi:type I restriction enzyme S subunit
MSEWKTYKLDEIATKLGDGLHGTPKYDDAGEYYFINGSNLVNGKIVINSNTKRVTEEEYIKYKKDLSDRTILLGINGTIGNVALFNNEKCILGKSACYINVDNKFDKQFIKYVLLSDDFQNYIKTNATGTTIKNVGLKLIREYEALIPSDINQQQEIASILSSLDDKIEINLQMNQTLEAMAQAIFKEWFVNFNFPGFDGELVDGLPKGWKMGKIGDMVTIKRGGSPRPIQNFISDSGLRWLKISDVTGLNTPFVLATKEYIKEEGLSKTTLLKKGALILSNSATPGIPKILNVDCCIHDGWLHFPTSNFSNEFLYLQFLKLRGELVNQANGSIFTNLKTEIVREFKVPIATHDVFQTFDNVVKPIFAKLLYNTLEIQTLTQIRDSLLPKLMTGKIEIQA